MGVREGSVEGEEGREKEMGEGSCRVGVSEVNAASSNCFRLRIVAATRIVVTPLPPPILRLPVYNSLLLLAAHWQRAQLFKTLGGCNFAQRVEEEKMK